MRYLFQIKNKLTKNKAHHIKILAQKQQNSRVIESKMSSRSLLYVVSVYYSYKRNQVTKLVKMKTHRFLTNTFDVTQNKPIKKKLN